MHAIHTVLRLTLKTKQKRFYLFAVWEYEEDNCRFISFLKYINKRSNGSGIRWKAIPQMCPLQQQLRFKQSVRRLEPTCFQKSIVGAVVFQQAFQVLHRLIIQSFKHKFQFLLLPSHIESASWLTAPEGGIARIVIRLGDNPNGAILQFL